MTYVLTDYNPYYDAIRFAKEEVQFFISTPIILQSFLMCRCNKWKLNTVNLKIFLNQFLVEENNWLITILES